MFPSAIFPHFFSVSAKAIYDIEHESCGCTDINVVAACVTAVFVVSSLDHVKAQCPQQSLGMGLSYP